MNPYRDGGRGVKLDRQPDPVALVGRAIETAVEAARERWERDLAGALAQVWDEARATVGPEVEDSRAEARRAGFEEGFADAAAIGLAAVARIREAVGVSAQVRSAERTAAIRAACSEAESLWNAVLR